MKRIVVSSLAFLWCIFLFYYGGVNFLERGFNSAYSLMIASLVFGAVYFYLGWKNK